MRVGIGYEARPFVEGRPLLLGGVEIPGLPGLAGEPAGDAVVAAVLDAILGAAGLAGPSLGPHPGAGAHEGDAEGGGRKSAGGDDGSASGTAPLAWLAEGVRRLERENYQVVNVDLTVRGSSVIGARRSAVAESLAGALHARPASVSVKVRRAAWGPAGGADGAAAGPPGREGGAGGIEVLAVALIDQIGDIDALHATLRSGG